MSSEDKITRKFGILAFLFTTPILFIIAFYYIEDPFRVIRDHKDISANSFVMLNKDMASTSIYLKNAHTEHFDSFIFGTSRTMGYRISDWSKYLPANAKPFVFDANRETLWGIVKKLEFLENSGAPLNNILIVIDPPQTFSAMRNSSGQLYIKDPRITGESKWTFQKTFLEAWLAELFFVKFIDYKMFGTIRPYMEGMITVDESNQIDPITAERNMEIEHRIEKDPDEFYATRKKIFYDRDTTVQQYFPELLNSAHLMALSQIKTICTDKGTDLKVVMGPNYDQYAIDPNDLKTLIKIFGKENVFDFSGINAITNNTRNYIESSHYRPHVGDLIMEKMYSPLTVSN